MVVIRLTRVGKKNSPAYRVVVADQQKAVKRKFIEMIGSYNPTQNPKQLRIDAERAKFWMSKGAKPSDTVNNLMVDLGILPKDKKINKIYGKKTKKKATEEKKGTESKETTLSDQTPEIIEEADSAPADQSTQEPEAEIAIEAPEATEESKEETKEAAVEKAEKEPEEEKAPHEIENDEKLPETKEEIKEKA